MTTKQLSQLIGQVLTLRDARTGVTYQAKISDAVSQYGKLRVTCEGGSGAWFEPTAKELEVRK